MTAVHASYGLLGTLAIALLAAAATDLLRRQIDNELTAAVALLAVPYWWASGLSLWPGVAMQVVFALGVSLVLVSLFACRALGGGDVKLLAAVALWFPWDVYVELALATALLGGPLALASAAHHRLARRPGPIEVPYGVAIAGGGLWVLATAPLLIAGQTR